MARLYLFIILGLSFLAITICGEESKQEVSEQTERLIEQDAERTEMSKVAGSRVLREARRGRRKGRKREQGGKRNTKRTDSKKGRQRRRNRCKKANKSKRKGGKKAGERESRNKKSKDGDTSTSCIRDIIWAHRLKTKGENYKRQAQRILRFNKTIGSKLSKMDEFRRVSVMLNDIGGGDSSALTCGGDSSTSSVGARSLQSVVETLDKCQTMVPAVCNTSAYALPPDIDMMMSCKDNFVKLAKAMAACGGLNTDTTPEQKLCRCYTGDGEATFAAIIEKAKKCVVLTSFNSDTTESNRKCTNAYKACSSAMKNSCDIIYTCSQSASALTTKQQQTNKNVDMVNAAADTLRKIAARTPDERRVLRDPAKQSVGCEKLIALSSELQTTAGNSPSNHRVEILAKRITATTVTCSAPQRLILQIQAAVLDLVRAAVQVVLDILTAVIEAATGSAPSTGTDTDTDTDTDIDTDTDTVTVTDTDTDTDTAGSSVMTTARAMSRRNMLVRNLMNKM